MAGSARSAHASLLTLGRIGSTDGHFDGRHQLVTLLAYIALADGVDRSSLATVFWPWSASPLNSLSSALTRVRSIDPRVIEVDRDLVSTTMRVDAIDTLDALDRDEPDAHLLATGDFLRGFRIRRIGSELEEWIFETRERISDAAAQNAATACQRAVAQGDQAQARALAKRSFDLASTEDALGGHVTLLRQAMSGDDPPLVVPPERLAFGRDDERARLVENLRSHRIANVHGLSGAGKTTLLRDFFADAPKGSRWVDLKHCATHAEISDRLADMPTSPANALTVIDHLPPLDPAVFHSLIDAQPGCFIVASRRPIQAPGLGHQLVGGLACDAEGEGSAPAIELFASRNTSSKEPSAARIALIADLCRAVGGLPGAVELLAQWAKVLPVTELAASLDDDSIFTTGPAPDLSSLASIAQLAWDELNEDERTTLLRLSVLPASFALATARAVGVVDLEVFGALRRSGLLERRGDRTGVQPLIRRFVLGKLEEQPDLHRQSEQAMIEHFANRLSAYEPLLASPNVRDCIAELRQEHDGTLAAFLLALKHGEAVRASDMLAPLNRYLLRSGQLHEADALYLEAMPLVEAMVDEHPRLCAEVASCCAWVKMLFAQNEEAERYAARGLEVVPEGAILIRVRLLRTQCALYGNIGNGEAALTGYLNAQELLTAVDEPALSALIDEDIGRAHLMLGNTERATAAFRATLDAGRRFADHHMQARAHLLLGVALTSTDPARSYVVFDEGEQMATENDLEHLRAHFPFDRGHTLLFEGRFAEAVEEFDAARQAAEAVGDHELFVACSVASARASLRAGRTAAGLDELRSGLREAVRSELWPVLLGAAFEVADMALTADPSSKPAHTLRRLAETDPRTVPLDLKRFGRNGDSPVQSARPMRPDEAAELTLVVASAALER